MYREIPKADGSGTTKFYRVAGIDDVVDSGSESTTTNMYDYNDTLNKPSINGVPLVGEKSLADLGIQEAGNYIEEIPAEYITENELNAKQYATQQYVIEQINGIEHFHREIVDALPLEGKANIIYLVKKAKAKGDVYNEYMWIDNDWEFIGTTSPDLSIFYTKEETDTLLTKKVTVEEGKGLSSNDYTNAEKSKLATLENYDDSSIWNAVNALENYNDSEVRSLIQDNADNIEINTNDIAAIKDKNEYQAELVRLIKSGDSWSWQDSKGNNLSFVQARDLLSQERSVLVLEDIEMDGKAIPLLYTNEGNTIGVVYMDDDKSNHILSIGEENYDINLGVFSTYNGIVSDVNSLPDDAYVGEIKKTSDTNDLYLYTENGWIPFDKGAAIDLSDYLSKTNTTPYNPTGAYNPATKRYVDTQLEELIPTKVSQLQNDTAYVGKSTKDLTYYYTNDNLYTKKEVDALIKNSGGGSSMSVEVIGDTLYIN